MDAAPTILALDLSLTGTGWCCDGDIGRLATPASRVDGWERIALIARAVRGLLVGVDVVVLEGYSFGSQGRAVFQIGELGGIIRFWLWGHHIPYVDVAPGTLKKFATGKGNSPKDAMIAAAIRRFGFEGSDNNEADAFLLWCLARQGYGHPVAAVPKAQAQVAASIDWPTLHALDRNLVHA